MRNKRYLARMDRIETLLSKGYRINRSKFRRHLKFKRTDAEKLLWNYLMNAHAKCEKEQKKIHFRQQVPIGPYFADFYCKYLSLDVEIDGGYHDHTKAYDLTRDLYMARRWIIVMRFKNDEVLTDIQTVISKIFDKNIRRELWDKLEWNCVGKRIQNIDCELWEMDFDEFQTLLR